MSLESGLASEGLLTWDEVVQQVRTPSLYKHVLKRHQAEQEHLASAFSAGKTYKENRARDRTGLGAGQRRGSLLPTTIAIQVLR